MLSLLRLAPALVGPLATGPPLRGAKIVVPLLPFLAGPSARVEIGFERGRLVLRLVLPTLPAQPAWTDPSWAEPDDDVGRHDAWARY